LYSYLGLLRLFLTGTSATAAFGINTLVLVDDQNPDFHMISVFKFLLK